MPPSGPRRAAVSLLGLRSDRNAAPAITGSRPSPGRQAFSFPRAICTGSCSFVLAPSHTRGWRASGKRRRVFRKWASTRRPPRQVSAPAPPGSEAKARLVSIEVDQPLDHHGLDDRFPGTLAVADPRLPLALPFGGMSAAEVAFRQRASEPPPLRLRSEPAATATPLRLRSPPVGAPQSSEDVSIISWVWRRGVSSLVMPGEHGRGNRGSFPGRGAARSGAVHRRSGADNAVGPGSAARYFAPRCARETVPAPTRPANAGHPRSGRGQALPALRGRGREHAASAEPDLHLAGRSKCESTSGGERRGWPG